MELVRIAFYLAAAPFPHPLFTYPELIASLFKHRIGIWSATGIKNMKLENNIGALCK
jgi:hypothetical protein